MPFVPSSFLFLVVRPGAPFVALLPQGNVPTKMRTRRVVTPELCAADAANLRVYAVGRREPNSAVVFAPTRYSLLRCSRTVRQGLIAAVEARQVSGIRQSQNFRR